MKKQTVIFLGFVGIGTFDEIYDFLEGYFSNLRRDTLESKIRLLKKGLSILELLDDETDLGGHSFILGPSAEVEEDQKFNNYLLEDPPERRNTGTVKWDILGIRVLKEIEDALETIKEDAIGLYKTPKKIELDYFEVSIKYHQFYRFFYEYYNADFLEPLQDTMKTCRDLLDNLEY